MTARTAQITTLELMIHGLNERLIAEETDTPSWCCAMPDASLALVPARDKPDHLALRTSTNALDAIIFDPDEASAVATAGVWNSRLPASMRESCAIQAMARSTFLLTLVTHLKQRRDSLQRLEQHDRRHKR